MEIAKLSVLQIYTPIFSEGIAKQFLIETRELWFVEPGERTLLLVFSLKQHSGST